MKITILGAGGNIGKRITQEAASRDHELKLITSKGKDYFGLNDTAETKKVDIFDTENLAEQIKGSDVLISSYAPPHENTDLIIEATKSLVEASKKANVRLIAVGGAGSLKINDELTLVESPNFPSDYKSIALSHQKALEDIYLKETELEWTNVSPSAYIFEGERTNNFRVGDNYLIANEKGESAISMEDFAVGILNEVENPKYNKQRFTLGY